jgi:hypothetical protein
MITSALPRCVALIVLGVAGCRFGTDAAPPRVVATELSAPMPLARQLRLTLERPAAVTVEYWAADGPRLRVRAPVSAQPELLLARLRPARTYQYAVNGTAELGTFTTDALPDDLRRVALTVGGQTTLPLVMLHLYEPTGFKGYAAVDGTGEIVWFWRTVDFPFGMTRRDGGTFVFMDKGRGLVEVSPSGVVVRELAQNLAQREMHHDVVRSPRNTLLFLAFDDRTVNGARLRGEAVWEWTPESNGAEKRWSAWDHFAPSTDRGPRFGGEWMHANALAIGPRQYVLMSVHY